MTDVETPTEYDSEGARVAVLYNFVGEDEYEVLRKKAREGIAQPPPDPNFKLEDISTLKEEILGLVDALIEAGYDAYPVNVQDNFHQLYAALTQPWPDVVFNLIEWFNDDGGLEDRVAAFYDLMEVPYTGAPPATLSICQRKGLTKQILEANGIPTPRYRILEKEPIPRLSGMRYPVIIKPAMEDASVGITQASVVENRKELVERIRFVLKEYEQPVLIEEYIDGRELGVSVLGTKLPRALPIEEMDFSDLPGQYRKIISFESKWDPMHEAFHKGKLVCPANLPEEIAREAQAIALKAFRVMGCRDYARVDMRLDDKGRLYVLEVNPNPDLTEGVAFMSSAEAAGLDFSDALKIIVDSALERGGYFEEYEDEEEVQGPELPPIPRPPEGMVIPETTPPWPLDVPEMILEEVVAPVSAAAPGTGEPPLPSKYVWRPPLSERPLKERSPSEVV
jgi:D-alanine-D-alanine ligase